MHWHFAAAGLHVCPKQDLPVQQLPELLLAGRGQPRHRHGRHSATATSVSQRLVKSALADLPAFVALRMLAYPLATASVLVVVFI